jgi:hypothetical protein
MALLAADPAEENGQLSCARFDERVSIEFSNDRSRPVLACAAQNNHPMTWHAKIHFARNATRRAAHRASAFQHCE